MAKNMLFIYRIGLITALLLTLYFTTTETEYALAQNLNDKLWHAVSFFGLSFLADYSFPDKGFTRSKVAALTAYGTLIEIIQYFLPYRSFSLLDIAGDLGGIMLYALLAPLIAQLPLKGGGRTS